MANRAELSDRISHARLGGCFIEVISIRLQYLDLWLRTIFSNTNQTDKRKREFGALLKQCKKYLSEDLYSRISDFNDGRIDAVHGYVIGTTSYGALADVIAKSDGLSEDLADFVILNFGEIVTDDFENQHHNLGDRIFHVASVREHLKSRVPI